MLRGDNADPLVPELALLSADERRVGEGIGFGGADGRHSRIGGDDRLCILQGRSWSQECV
jgi:hypothetical protein